MVNHRTPKDMHFRTLLVAIVGLLACCLAGGTEVAQTEQLIGDQSGIERGLSADTPKPAAKAAGLIIPSAGAAALYNGNGDIDPAGACDSFVAKLCENVRAGEGRLATCLLDRKRAEQRGNVAGKKLSDKCVTDLNKFMVDRSANINKDVPLARACKDDVAKLCPKTKDTEQPGSTLACLRQVKPKLSSACIKQVFRTQLEAVQNYKVNAPLATQCKADIEKLCREPKEEADKEADKDADSEEKAKEEEDEEADDMECLKEHDMSLSWQCRAEILKNDIESRDDIRLSTRLFFKCFIDSQRFCKGVEPGHMRVQECLEDHMDESTFSTPCRQELESVLEKTVKNFQLDTGLRTACENDLINHCGVTLDEIDMDESGAKKKGGTNCLQQYKDELGDDCKAQVHRMLSRSSRDIRFDEALAEACTADRSKYCTEVQPGSARVIRCLEDHRQSLDTKCAAALFDHEVRLAEDIDFKYPMKKACAWEMKSFCADVPHGQARIIRCLETHMDHVDMSKDCKAEVTRDMNRMATDWRLNWRLNHACQEDITRMHCDRCSTAGQTCGALVLQCLQENQENITRQECQEEVFYFELMEVNDYRNDIILAEACRDDVKEYCKDVEPGEGRVHQCLRINKDKIKDKCRTEEMKLAAVEYKDIRLRPKLNKACSEERAIYCKGVKPGKARVVKCLLENMAAPNFGEECKEELEKREEQMKTDYRYDAGVAASCAGDIDEHCADARKQLRGNATVLKCLVDKFKAVTDGCQSELSRTVRLALWDYKPASPLTAVCDDDVTTLCPAGPKAQRNNPFTIGVVGRCLSKELVAKKHPLAPKCHALVLVAAPKDARPYFENSQNPSGMVDTIMKMQQATNVQLISQQSGASTVTVTGWVALVCVLSLIVVILGGAFLLYRRYVLNTDKPNTMYVKVGDA